MNQFVVIAADLIAITALVVVFFARHHRCGPVVAFVTVNVGMLAFANILATTEVGLGVGLGLFGVLSIVRRRSSRHEVTYCFAALADGLVAASRNCCRGDEPCGR